MVLKNEGLETTISETDSKELDYIMKNKHDIYYKSFLNYPEIQKMQAISKIKKINSEPKLIINNPEIQKTCGRPKFQKRLSLSSTKWLPSSFENKKNSKK
ncbi:hypothetical protein BB559_005159, partial [Furculomyces boomerangus]